MKKLTCPACEQPYSLLNLLIGFSAWNLSCSHCKVKLEGGIILKILTIIFALGGGVVGFLWASKKIPGLYALYFLLAALIVEILYYFR